MRIARLLVAKSLAETVFVAALALSFYLTTAPAFYRGWSEVTPRGVAGWAISRGQTAGEAVEVQLYVDERFAGNARADLPRPDVVRAGRASDERCGFNFDLATLAPGEHDAQVYTLYRDDGTKRGALLALGPRLRFRVEAGKDYVSLPARDN